ncbi:outer membrane lipoprotein SlyB [Orbus hercynius]|uniref:Outer membrane lipoprotein SlyB n=1 Tax=Orbus hercynius TaxID=593135 RepID=A0A495RCT4_9GAMM|nr:glycine zipper 2TM domain-containing protein [Orbus hercynius]RKS85096.1 outer membrane lipoprotein SlyB [Orbus hercynius]
MKKVAVLACLAILLAGCQNSDIYSGDVYSADQAKQVQQVTYGTVLSVRPVKIQTNASNGSTNTVIGSLSGAVLGGFLGNTIGNGTGKSLAIAGGAIGGALVGSEVQNAVSETNAVELEVRQENGSTIVLVQKATPNQFQVGQEVRLVTNGKQVNASPR